MLAVIVLLPLTSTVIGVGSGATTLAAADPNQVVFYSDCSSGSGITYRIDPSENGGGSFVSYGSNVRVSPDGKRVAVTLNNATIKTFDTDTGANVHLFTDTEPFSAGWTGNPAWSPDSTKIAIGVARYDDVAHNNWAIRTFTDDASNTSTVTRWSHFVVTALDWSGGTWLASFGDATDPAHVKGGVGTTSAGSDSDSFVEISGAAPGVSAGQSPRFDSYGHAAWTQQKPGATGLYVDGALKITMDAAAQLAFAPGGEYFAAIRYRPNAFNLDIITTSGTYVRTINQSPTVCGLDWLGVRNLPRASFTATEHATGSSTWDFDGTASSAFAPGTIEKYGWKFGDPANSTATGPNPSFKYPHSGTYTVALTVTDSAGLQNTITKEIGVKQALIVNSTGDSTNGADAGEDCDTGGTVGSQPECTLRAAIEAANTANRAQTVSFAIDSPGVPEIVTASSLPKLTASVTIDGTTQPGGWVQVTAPDVTSSTGLVAAGPDITFTGMVLSGFHTAIGTKAANTTIIHNRIGVDSTGSTVTTAPRFAVFVADGTNALIKDNVMTATSSAVQVGSSTVPVTATISDNRIGTGAGSGNSLSTLPEDGVVVVNGSATIDGNTISGTNQSVLIKTTLPGTTITHNRIGVNTDGTHENESGIAVMVDGSPGVLIENNVLATSSAGWADVIVTGSNQFDPFLHTPSDPLHNAVTGGNVTVRGNTLGMRPDGSAVYLRTTGVLVFGLASNVTIDGNFIGGHDGAADVWVDTGSEITVTNNRIGVSPDGMRVTGSPGVGIKFGGVSNSTITGNLVNGAKYDGIDVERDSDPSVGAESSGIAISGNAVGLAIDGKSVLGNGNGIHVRGATITVGPGNLISGSTQNGILAEPNGEGLTIEGNQLGTDSSGTLARPNAVGIRIEGLSAEITSNRIASSTGAAISINAQVYVTLVGNEIGFGEGGTPLGNGSGIVYEAGNGVMSENNIRNSTGAGIATAAISRVTIFRNSTWNNGAKGIDGTGTPPAPTLDAVVATLNGHGRFWFVVSDLAESVGVINVYGNESCTAPNDDEGSHFIATSILVATPTAQVLAMTNPTGLRYAGYTVTFTVSDGGTVDRPLGHTSNFSVCAAPHTYDDTSGTGIPDIIQNALGGNPANPKTAVFPSDAGGVVRLGASSGRLTDVGPSDAPAPPEGVGLVASQFSFQLTGLTPGAHAAVAVETSGSSTYYYRYGPPAPGQAAKWYGWEYDPTTGTGARHDPSGAWVLNFIDGAAGDDDGVANGTIVDPGGPGNGPSLAVDTTTPTTTAATTPVTTPTSAPTTSMPHTRGLPATGAQNASDMVVMALLAIGGGVLLLAARRRSSLQARPRH